VFGSLYKQYTDSTITNCEVSWPKFGFQANGGTTFSQKRKQVDLKIKDIFGHRKKISHIARK
jgi:hypothetical protein